MGKVRSAVNEIVPGRIYQRGQILTWQREKKYTMLKEHGIRTVVNFWPKVDPDMTEAPIDNYLLLAAPKSSQMLDRRMELAVPYIVALSEESPVLVLCEAGVTRSVYFCVLLVAKIEGISLLKAYNQVQSMLRSKLKPFMLQRFRQPLEDAYGLPLLSTVVIDEGEDDDSENDESSETEEGNNEVALLE